MPAPLISVLLDDEPMDPRLLDQILRLEVRESDEDPTVAALRLRLSQEPTGTFFPIDSDLLGPGVRLAVEAGAPGGSPRRLFSGWITHLRPHFESIESNCYVEVLGMDAAMLLDAEERTASYPDASDSDAVSEILGRYNLRGEVDPTPETHRADRRLLVQRSTDWQFVKLLAARNGYVCYFEYDSAAGETVGHFKPRPLDSEPQPDLTILREAQNLDWVDLQWVMTGPVRHRGAAFDALEKRVVEAEGEPRFTPLGEDGLAESIEEGLQSGGVATATALLRGSRPTDQGLTAESSGRTDSDRFVLEARGQLDPRLYRNLLQARRNVLIKGLGARMTGVFYVKTVRTAIEEGRLTQTFIAERNALGQTGQEEFGQSAEEEPAQ